MQNRESNKTDLTTAENKVRLRNRTPLVLALLSATSVIFIDQLTKYLARKHLKTHSIKLIGPVSLKLEYNSGIAFSLFSSHPLVIEIIVILVCLALIYYALKNNHLVISISLGMILGGALSNFADRIFTKNKEVTDFIYTSFWPTFNIADASIVIGCAIMALSLALKEHEKNTLHSTNTK